MSVAQKIAVIARKFRRQCPITLHDIFKMGFSLEFVGEGSYRRAYRISGLPLIVKVPHDSEAEISECIEHSSNEIDALHQVKTKKEYKSLKKYLPEVYYQNRGTGIILMKEYKESKSKKNAKLRANAASEISDTMKEFDFNIDKNFAIVDGKVTLLDWGILGDETEWYHG